MSEQEQENTDSQVFDVERIRQLIEMMTENELSEIDLRHSKQRIKLRRGDDTPVPTIIAPQGVAPPMMQAPAAATPPPVAASSGAAEAGGTPADEPNMAYVKSPMVGTFYSKPNPNSETYVKVGDHVNSETTVCTVEAMKMFNEIPAGISGKIVAVLVDNEEPVDVNKPLFKVDTSQ